MSYEVLARRLRPTTFDDVVGQEHVTVTLRNALRTDRLPHAILLCGPRGVGKTSIARILARSLNCDKGPTDKPCGSCAACREIAHGTSLDVQEIDAASHTGVENVREIRDSIRFSAAPGKHRIFIIDEVHMLSSAAFNALLKTLEEPPPRSLFIFATTDPQKIPDTVLSRVQRHDLRRHSASELLASLQKIRSDEGLEVPDAVLRALIREGEGSFRDVLTLLDRLISGLGKEISEERAALVLGLIDQRQVREIVDAVLARDAAGALQTLARAIDKGTDPARLAASLLEELRDLLVARIVDKPGELISAPAEELEELRRRATPHEAETLQRLFRVLLTRVQDLQFAPRPSYALEVAVVRLATLPDAASLATLLERLDALEAGAPSGAQGSGAGGGGEGAVARTRPASPAPAAERPKRAPAPASKSSPAPASDAAPTPVESVVAARTAEEPEPDLAPPPSDADAPPLELESRPLPPPPPPAPTLDPETQRRLKQEAKTHPAVLTAIEVLDAELRDIRLPRPPGPSA
jgi:DNA polymerase-3 subunit gamma/tau